MKPTLVLLAAGMGSRYGGLKQVDAVGPSGETIMDYSMYDALRSGFGKVIFVIRREIEPDFREAFTNKLEGKVDFEFVYQELDNLPAGISVPEGRVKPWGTGHAVMVAAGKVKEPFAVINADDFYGKDAYSQMAGFLNADSESTDYAMVGYQLDNTLSEFGYVSRGVCQTGTRDELISVTEHTKIRKENHAIVYEGNEGTQGILPGSAVVSMNFWGFKPAFFGQLQELFGHFIQTSANSIKSEFYLSSAIDALIKSDRAAVTVLRTQAKWFGVTYKEDKPSVAARIQSLIATGEYPARVWGG